jgi:hypothetical protein
METGSQEVKGLRQQRPYQPLGPATH